MQSTHDPALRADFPQLAVATLTIDQVHDDAEVADTVARFTERAATRLQGATESELPEIAAWRRAFG